ncbi:hypothetical protein [Micromonospora sp. NPDC047134]|uniref:hypothetical protein n=1 Tax=Micromonospora sp. NPDC047134 TaxID=3154340 RepID=UPI0033EF921E
MSSIGPHKAVPRRAARAPLQAEVEDLFARWRESLPAARNRILDEAHATNGDVRRLTDLRIAAGNRYAATADHSDLPDLT